MLSKQVEVTFPTGYFVGVTASALGFLAGLALAVPPVVQIISRRMAETRKRRMESPYVDRFIKRLRAGARPYELWEIVEDAYTTTGAYWARHLMSHGKQRFGEIASRMSPDRIEELRRGGVAGDEAIYQEFDYVAKFKRLRKK